LDKFNKGGKFFMIITIKGATFTNNIGTLNTWPISISLGSGATSSNNITYIEKNAAYTTTITIADGYEIGSAGVTATMGGSPLTVDTSANPFTISIASVTGPVKIKVPTKNIATGEEDDPVNPPSGESNYIDITTQGTIKGSIKDGVINMSDSSSLYYLTKVALPSNAVSVEYQAFKTGGSYGSAFANDAGTVVKFLPRTDVTTGDRVTEAVPSGATWFYHMWDDPTENEKQTAPAFTYIRVYTEGEIETPEGLPFRITEQTQNNNKMLDVTTGQVTPVSDDGTGAQTITVCNIPTGATTVNYQMFKTGKTYGSGFFNGSTFISGHANNTESSGTRKTLTIPSGATEFWHMYPNRAYINSGGIAAPEFDYIEFA
jgi:hypothetical protein